VSGIHYTASTGANVVARNLIYGLTSADQQCRAEINGIRVSGGNDNVSEQYDCPGGRRDKCRRRAATNAGTTGINGINEAGRHRQHLPQQRVYCGSPTAGTGASYAFNSTITTNTRAFRDNIFFNARSNSGATGKNVCRQDQRYRRQSERLDHQHNVYLANGTGGVFGFFNSLDVANLAGMEDGGRTGRQQF